MKICIPTTENSGTASRVYGHFGSAPFFIIYDTEKELIDVVNNSDSVHEHGQCNPLSSFREKKIDIMVTGGIGFRALERLNAGGVKAYKTVNETTVADVVESFKNNRLKEITVDQTCGGHHGCH